MRTRLRAFRRTNGRFARSLRSRNEHRLLIGDGYIVEHRANPAHSRMTNKALNLQRADALLQNRRVRFVQEQGSIAVAIAVF